MSHIVWCLFAPVAIRQGRYALHLTLTQLPLAGNQAKQISLRKSIWRIEKQKVTGCFRPQQT